MGTDRRVASLLLGMLSVGAPAAAAQTTWFVDADATGAATGASWDDAYTSLRPALTNAQPGDSLWVAEGTYGSTTWTQPGLPRSATIAVPAGVSVYGGFAGGEASLELRDPVAHPTVLSGELGAPGVADNAWHAVTIVGPGTTTRLDGLVIRDGNANGTETADRRGGGILTDVDIHLVDCTVTANLSDFVAAGLACDGADATIEGCTFTGNDSGLRVSGGAALVQDSLFDGNTGASVIFADAADFVVAGCEFTNGGGGVSVGSGSTGVVRDCHLHDNLAASITGSSAGDFRVERCLFEDNHSQGSGGALSIAQSFNGVTVADCDFLRNSSDASGGAMFLNGTVVDIHRCRFVDNTAAFNGGAVTYWFETIGGSGGSEVTGCVFLGNSANQGGALSGNGGQGGFMVWGASPVVSDSLLSGNTATDGGAFYIDGASEPRFVNSTIVGNVATGAGGGLYARDAGLIPEPGVPTVTVENTIVWGNVDGSDGGVEATQLFADPGLFVVDRSCIEGWTGGLGGVGNHGLDPLFADADGPDDVAGTADDDATLLTGSPCIDAGDTSRLVADGADMDCDGDTAEVLSLDLSLVRRVDDDPHTTDTGAGPAPIVDMGAYEASAWEHLGQALAGVGGEPCLVGEGTLVGGTPFGLSLANAAPSATAVLFLGVSAIHFPFAGGVVVPAPDELIVLGTDADGAINAMTTALVGVPPGVPIWFQYWILDAGAPFGLAASNAVVATTP